MSGKLKRCIDRARACSAEARAELETWEGPDRYRGYGGAEIELFELADSVLECIREADGPVGFRVVREAVAGDRGRPTVHAVVGVLVDSGIVKRSRKGLELTAAGHGGRYRNLRFVAALPLFAAIVRRGLD